MSGTTVLKRRDRQKPKNPNRRLATEIFKKGTYTSQWTEQDAKQYFGMAQNEGSVLRTGKNDPGPAVEWIKFKGEIKKKVLDAETD